MAGSTLPVSLFLGWPSVSRPARRTGPAGEGVREQKVEGGFGGHQDVVWCGVQLNPMVTRPPLVLWLREALPPMAQTEINSVMEAARNCEFVRVDIFTTLAKLGLEDVQIDHVSFN